MSYFLRRGFLSHRPPSLFQEETPNRRLVMGMACSGRRSKLGSLHGPMNHESLNGTSLAMLSVQQFNSDVQLPYRLPLCQQTHSAACADACVEEADEQNIVEAAQFGQDAQPGYACDYCSKRQPMAFNEAIEDHERIMEEDRRSGPRPRTQGRGCLAAGS